MSDVDTAEQTASAELPDNLVAIPSGELHERAEALAAEADTLLAADDWVNYKATAENERKLRAEIERRGDAARKDTPVETTVPVSAQEKLEQTRQALAGAEAALADFAGVKKRGNAPPPMGESAEETDDAKAAEAKAFVNVEKLRADLAAMEHRAPFLDIDDDSIATELEDTGIEAEGLRLDLKRFIDEGRRQAAAKAERQLAEVTERHYALMREDGVRKSERKRESLIEQMAQRKALFARQQSLKDWTRRKQELEESLQREVREGESPHYDIGPLREASEIVDWLNKAIEGNLPLTSTELERHRAEVRATAPGVRGSFKS